MAKKKVILIQGGLGAERNVSLVTGQGFSQALVELGYSFETIDAREDLLQRLTSVRSKDQNDVALLALHGKYAEDGIVQSICEYIKLPYTGSGVLGSALCMDKIFSKQILSHNGIPTPECEVLDLKTIEVKNVPMPKIPWPVVVKPSREGSSVGVSIVRTAHDFLAAVAHAGRYDHMVLVEKFIAGMELTVPILDGKALTPIEIVPKVDFYTYENKYTSGKTDYYLPARIDAPVLEKAKELALRSFEICRLRSYGRVDFRVDSSGGLFLIEINTLPGCTPTSLLPKAARHDGIDFNRLVEILIEGASLDYEGLA